MLTQLQSRLTNLDTRISEIDAEITELQAQSGGSTEVMNIITGQINRLNTNKTILVSRKTDIQAQIDQYNSSWTTEEQVVVDEIDTLFNSQYHTLIEEVLKSYSSERRAEFFTLYAGATNECQKHCVIKFQFNL